MMFAEVMTLRDSSVAARVKCTKSEQSAENFTRGFFWPIPLFRPRSDIAAAETDEAHPGRQQAQPCAAE